MKIGVLATGYNCVEYFDAVLDPWIQYKEKYGNLVISAVSVLFRNHASTGHNNLAEPLTHAFKTKKIDYLAIPQGSFEENDARNLALTPLLKENVDYIILLDFDEVYTLEQIEKIFQFVADNPFTTWFKLRFKNYVFDEKHYVDDFCPPRIFSTKSLAEFYYDNDVNYYSDGGKVSYKNCSSMEVPRNVAFINHYSWCGSPERLQRKVEYQLKHFDGICSYAWNEKDNKLALNYDFYKKYNVPIPTIYEEHGT